MSKKRVVELAYEMLDVMYQCSDPPISWYQILDEHPKDFFKHHYLDPDDCYAIYEYYRRLVPKHYRSSFAFLFLDYAPTGVKGE